MPSKLDQLADHDDDRRRHRRLGVDRLRLQANRSNHQLPSLIYQAAQLPAYAHSVRRSDRLGPALDRPDDGGGRSGVIDFVRELTPHRPRPRVDRSRRPRCPSTSPARSPRPARPSSPPLRRARHRARAHPGSRSLRPGKAPQAAATLQARGDRLQYDAALLARPGRAAAVAGAFLISPLVGRIPDWHVKAAGGAPYTGENRPRRPFRSRRSTPITRPTGIKTVVMGLPFRKHLARSRPWLAATG